MFLEPATLAELIKEVVRFDQLGHWQKQMLIEGC